MSWKYNRFPLLNTLWETQPVVREKCSMVVKSVWMDNANDIFKSNSFIIRLYLKYPHFQQKNTCFSNASDWCVNQISNLEIKMQNLTCLIQTNVFILCLDFITTEFTHPDSCYVTKYSSHFINSNNSSHTIISKCHPGCYHGNLSTDTSITSYNISRLVSIATQAFSNLWPIFIFQFELFVKIQDTINRV